MTDTEPALHWDALGKLIAERRRELGIPTQQAAADQAGISKNTWQRLENAQPVRQTSLLLVANVLKWHLSYANAVLRHGEQPDLGQPVAPESMPDGERPFVSLRERPGDQPLPTPNQHPDIQTQVIADIQTRRQVGIQRYGTALQPHNGRDALRDLYEELLDGAMYVKQAMVERDDDPALAAVEDMARDLYKAQDAIAFARECCDIADRKHTPVTTAMVRQWLEGAKCGRQLLADRPTPQDEAWPVDGPHDQQQEADRG